MEDLLKALKDINDEKKTLEEREKTIKASIESNLNEEGYKTDYVTVSYSSPSTTTTVDLKTLQEKEPDLYDDLLKDYPKVTNRKGSFSYRFK